MTSSRVTARPGPDASQGDREVLRLAPPVALWWVWLAFVTVNVADYAAQGLPSARFGSVVSAILLLVTALAYVLALRPRVVLDGGGLTVLNPFRTHHVPWSRVTSVDTAEWVRVHYVSSPSGDDSGSPSGAGPASPSGDDSASHPGEDSASHSGEDSASHSGEDRKVHCWALYVSARAKRKIARRAAGSGSAGYGSAGYASGDAGSSSRLPDEAKYLASLPVAKAMAIRLDTRARRERARTPGPAAADVVARWSWSSIAITVVPALILVVVALV